MSPTIHIKGAEPYAFRFFSSDILEPPHVHVLHGEKKAKIWLETVTVAWNRGFNKPELNKVLSAVRKHRKRLLGEWNAYFSKA